MNFFRLFNLFEKYLKKEKRMTVKLKQKQSKNKGPFFCLN